MKRLIPSLSRLTSFSRTIILPFAIFSVFLSLVIVARSNIYIMSIMALSLPLFVWVGFRWKNLFLCFFLVLLPILGWINVAWRINGVSILLPLFMAGLIGREWNYRRNNVRTIHLPNFIWLYVFSLCGSVLHAIFPYVLKLPLGNVGLLRTPWGLDIYLYNGIGWVLLGFIVPLCGVFFYEWVRETCENSSGQNRILKAIFAGVFFASLIGFFQYSGWEKLASGGSFMRAAYPQFNASFSHPNSAGLFASLLLPVWCGVLFGTKGKKGVLWAVGPALVFLLVVAASRSGFIILSVSFLLMGAYAGFIRKNKLVAVTFSILLLIGTFSIAHHFSKFEDASRIRLFKHQISMFLQGEDSAEDLLGDRGPLWKAGWIVFKHNPVLGVGVGNYLIKIHHYRDEIGIPVNDNSGNMYLQVAAEQGILGLLIFLILLFSIFKSFFRRSLSKTSTVQASSFSSFVGLLAALIFGAHILSFEVNVIFWLLTALILPGRKKEARSLVG